MTERPLVLVTGASGYVGGRLIEELSGRWRLRCLARRPEYLRERVPSSIEIVAGDVLDKDSLHNALSGVDTAYYLIHSMGSSGDFEEEDRRAAQNFGEVARECGVRRIIYLGGLGEAEEGLSSHLRSRHEVGHVLRASGVQVIEFRASIVLGSGSLSFEMIRALTERLPVMTTPTWVQVPAQPIAIRDLLGYLTQALTLEVDGNPIYEIGGSDVVSYGDLMKEYARQRGLKRWIIPVPVLTPGLSSRWLGLVTPLYARVGRKLIDSVRHPTLVKDGTALEVFDVEPIGVREAIAAALRNEDREFAATRWSDAFSSGDTLKDWGGVRFGNRVIASETIRVGAAAESVFTVIERMGGSSGWYYANWLWTVRGFLDLLVGGVGLRRGRRDPERLRVGDVVDWWRVVAIERHRHLRLAAEMRLPGRAWLEFAVEGGGGETTVTQTAIFDPVGLFGLVYWYGLYPIHKMIFAGMLRGVGKRAQSKPVIESA
jgi:uncharacterized protein YbjT (DUF2867 family)